MYVIWNSTERKYVSKYGRKSSFTDKLQYARVFPNKESAEKECCPGNERVIALSEIMERMQFYSKY